MWFSVVRTLIDNDMCLHSGQNVADSQGASVQVSPQYFHCDDIYHKFVSKSTDNAKPHSICFFNRNFNVKEMFFFSQRDTLTRAVFSGLLSTIVN